MQFLLVRSVIDIIGTPHLNLKKNTLFTIVNFFSHLDGECL